MFSNVKRTISSNISNLISNCIHKSMLSEEGPQEQQQYQQPLNTKKFLSFILESQEERKLFVMLLLATAFWGIYYYMIFKEGRFSFSLKTKCHYVLVLSVGYFNLKTVTIMYNRRIRRFG